MCKVYCNNCGFEGVEDDLILCMEENGVQEVYNIDVYTEKSELYKGCPNCKDDSYLMDKE